MKIIKVGRGMIQEGKIGTRPIELFQEVEDLHTEESEILPLKSLSECEAVGIGGVRIKVGRAVRPASVIEGGKWCVSIILINCNANADHIVPIRFKA
jgi:hypothetical protein